MEHGVGRGGQGGAHPLRPTPTTSSAHPTSLLSRPYPPGMRVLPQGFVGNMEQWMAACDVIVTKAGPGTIAEAVISGLPMLLNGFIPCQEAGNVPFVVGGGAGAFERDPTEVGRILARWLGPPGSAGAAELSAMKARVSALGKGWKDALSHIVDDLAALCRERAGAPRVRSHAVA